MLQIIYPLSKVFNFSFKTLISTADIVNCLVLKTLLHKDLIKVNFYRLFSMCLHFDILN